MIHFSVFQSEVRPVFLVPMDLEKTSTKKELLLAFSHGVTAAMLVFQNKEPGNELYFYEVLSFVGK